MKILLTIKSNPQAKSGSLDELFVQLVEAILKKRVVEISYRMSHKQKNELFHLRPYHLLYCKHQWNVLGTIDNHNSIRILKLNQIKKLRIMNKRFAGNGKFDIQEFLGRAWSMLPEGRLYHIKLKFLPQVASDVAEIQWHSTQIVSWLEDGSAILGFRVDGLNEIKWWILSYGDQVQVLAPKILQRKTIETAEKIIKLNRQLLSAQALSKI